MTTPDPRSTPWLSLALVASSALLTIGAAVAPSPQAASQLEALRSHASLYATEKTPPACEELVADTNWSALAVKSSGIVYEKLCTRAVDAGLSAGVRRVALVPPGHAVEQSPWAWLLHPLVFANPLVAVLAWLLGGAALAATVELQWGRRHLSALVATASLAAAVTWRCTAGEGTAPWTGGQAWLAALAGAVLLRWPADVLTVQLPSAWLRGAEVRGWHVVATWAALRLVAMLWGDAGRTALFAELMGLATGVGWVVLERANAFDRVAALIQSRRQVAQAAAQAEAHAATATSAIAGVDRAVATGATAPHPVAASPQQDLSGPDAVADVTADDLVGDGDLLSAGTPRSAEIQSRDRPPCSDIVQTVEGGLSAGPGGRPVHGEPSKAGVGWLLGQGAAGVTAVDIDLDLASQTGQASPPGAVAPEQP